MAVVFDGRKAVAAFGTAVQLTTQAVRADTLVITAFAANTKVIAVGGSTVLAAVATGRGAALPAGASLVLHNVEDTSKIFIDSQVNGEGVTFTAFYS